MEEERLFPKLNLQQFFMHPRRQSMEQLSDSSVEKNEKRRNDSYDELSGKGSWQKLLLTNIDKSANQK